MRFPEIPLPETFYKILDLELKSRILHMLEGIEDSQLEEILQRLQITSHAMYYTYTSFVTLSVPLADAHLVTAHPDAQHAMQLSKHLDTAKALRHRARLRPSVQERTDILIRRIERLRLDHRRSTGWIAEASDYNPGWAYTRQSSLRRR